MEGIDCPSFRRRKVGQPFNNYEKKVLLGSFLNKSKLTEETKKALSNELGLHWTYIRNFFFRMTKRPINEVIEEYEKILLSKKLK